VLVKRGLDEQREEGQRNGCCYKGFKAGMTFFLNMLEDGW